MGVDFFPCYSCGESICDCGHYQCCNDECNRKWCDKKCAERDGYREDDDEDPSCSYCRNEQAEDTDLFAFLLKKYDLKRDDVLAEYLKEQNNV